MCRVTCWWMVEPGLAARHVCSKAWAFPTLPPVQVPSLTFVIFEVGQPLQLVLSGRPRSRPGLWRIRNPLAQGGAARLTMNQISLRSSAQMGRWHVSSSCGLLCGPLEGCF